MGGTAFSVGAVFLHGIGTVLSWIVLSVYFGFFLTMETRKVNTESLLPFLKPETRSDVVYLIKEFVNIIVVFFRGQLIIAFLQGVLFAVGFTLAGLRCDTGSSSAWVSVSSTSFPTLEASSA